MARRFNKLAKIRKSKRRAGNHSARKKRQNTAIMANASAHVLNLSHRQLTNSEIKALAKGLKFIPTPKTKKVRNNIARDFDEFARKLRCKYHFHSDENKELHPFRENTGFIPDYSCPALEKYIDLTKLEITSIEISKQVDNLTSEERLALYELRNNKDIVIKKADKNSTVVVINRNDYIAEGLRQLSTDHYVEIEKPDIISMHNMIQDTVHNMHRKGSLDKVTFGYLTNINTKELKLGRMYLLPKIHKMNLESSQSTIQMPTSRPIISQTQSVVEKIGRYADHFLIPIVLKQETYIKDTSDFIHKIESLHIPNNCLLAAYDITSMYTNLTFNELLSAACHY